MTTSAPALSIVQAHFAASVAASERFFEAEAPRVADCCRRMADRFCGGGTLYVVGQGAQASDAQHVSVEFVHPIIVGKRALPAVALTSDAGVMTAVRQRTADDVFGAALQTLARPNDMLLALCDGAAAPAIRAAIEVANQNGLLTILVSGTRSPRANATIEFAVGESQPLLVQEVTETLYHVLWELVHVFIEAKETPSIAFLTSAFRRDDHELTDHVTRSTREKARDVAALRHAIVSRCEGPILAAGLEIASRVKAGGRLFAIGNGGSATDAQDAAVDCLAPPIARWRPIPALALTNDIGVITAIGNDVGFDRVFTRQIAAFAGSNDILLNFSTSGSSRNILAAVAEARVRGLLTIALSGGDGGELARSANVEFCFTAPSEHLPRIQEAHATTWHALLSAAQEALL